MIKKTITYTDVNGLPRTEDFWFNLSIAEYLELDYAQQGGMEARINKLVADNDSLGMMNLFKDFILKAYGTKSEDGRRFVKSPELSENFYQMDAYSQLLMEFLQNTDAAVEFFKGVLPPTPAQGSVAPMTVLK